MSDAQVDGVQSDDMCKPAEKYVDGGQSEEMCKPADRYVDEETSHTDPEQASGWTLTTTQANGCLRTFNVVSKSSLANQNLLWGHL